MSRPLAILTIILGLLMLFPVRAQEPALDLGRAAFDAKMHGQFALAIGLFDRALLEGNLSAAQRGMVHYGAAPVTSNLRSGDARWPASMPQSFCSPNFRTLTFTGR